MRNDEQRRDDDLLSTEQLAAYLQVPVSTLYQWRHQRKGPPGLRIGRHLRYRWTDVKQWLKTRAVAEK